MNRLIYIIIILWLILNLRFKYFFLECDDLCKFAWATIILLYPHFLIYILLIYHYNRYLMKSWHNNIVTYTYLLCIIYVNKTRRANQLYLYIAPFLSLFRRDRRSNRTATGYADSWRRPGLSASNGATSCRPISGICRRCSTAGNVSCGRRINRNEPWSENSRTRMADCSRTSERFVFNVFIWCTGMAQRVMSVMILLRIIYCNDLAFGLLFLYLYINYNLYILYRHIIYKIWDFSPF